MAEMSIFISYVLFSFDRACFTQGSLYWLSYKTCSEYSVGQYHV